MYFLYILQADGDDDKEKLMIVLNEIICDYLVKSRYYELHSLLKNQTSDEIHYKVSCINDA